jgi:AraC family transcriptional regulator
MGSLAPQRFEPGQPMLLAGLRQRHQFAAGDPDLAGQWRQFKLLGELPGQIGSNFYGVMCGHDASGFEYMCGVEVAGFAGLPETIGRMRVPAQQYAVFSHPGDASTLRSTWQQILEWLAGSRYESAHRPDFERYTAPGSNGAIEVWIGVVPGSDRDAHENRI